MKTLATLALFAFASASLADDGCTHTTALSCPTTVSAALAPSDCSAFDGSRFDRYQFSGTFGQTVTVAMNTTSFDALVILIDPTGFPVALNDDAASGGTDASLTFNLTSTGTWTIVTNSLGANASGNYVLSFSSPSCGPPPPRRRSVRH